MKPHNFLSRQCINILNNNSNNLKITFKTHNNLIETINYKTVLNKSTRKL